MLKFLIALLFVSSPALAAPKLTYEYTGNGSSVACASDMTESERTNLWKLVLQELEFAGYKPQEIPNQDAREFTNGFYFLILSQEDNGFCVTYKDAYQPQIPAMYQGNS